MVLTSLTAFESSIKLNFIFSGIGRTCDIATSCEVQNHSDARLPRYSPKRPWDENYSSTLVFVWWNCNEELFRKTNCFVLLLHAIDRTQQTGGLPVILPALIRAPEIAWSCDADSCWWKPLIFTLRPHGVSSFLSSQWNPKLSATSEQRWWETEDGRLKNVKKVQTASTERDGRWSSNKTLSRRCPPLRIMWACLPWFLLIWRVVHSLPGRAKSSKAGRNGPHVFPSRSLTHF